MFQIEYYMKRLISLLRERFGERLLYVGLQGSYLRGEATEKSDIDVMAVLDNLAVTDLDAYRECLLAAGNYERSCGFLCGRAELACWNPLEICQLIHTTKDYYGELSRLVPFYTANDLRNYIRLSLGNLYHELCHRYIHADRETNRGGLAGSCKAVFFILQNKVYLEQGVFPATRQALIPCLSAADRKVLELTNIVKSGTTVDFEKAFSLLFSWCQREIVQLGETL